MKRRSMMETRKPPSNPQSMRITFGMCKKQGARCVQKREEDQYVFLLAPLLPSDEYGLRIIPGRFELDENGIIVRESTSRAYGSNRWAIPLGSVPVE